MPWWLVKQIRRAVRKIARKVGAVSPYDFYDWRVPWASKKDIQQDRERYNALNTDGRFVIDSKNEYIVRDLKYINTEHGISYIPTYVRDLWGAKQVYKHKPSSHYDCGSSFCGFTTLLIPMGINIVLIDIRDLTDRFNTSLLKDIWGGGWGNLTKKRKNKKEWNKRK
ncbi:MAG: hypothetical protein PUG77_00920 [Helicobacter bilis]|uniref:hypothetical protein n=1 Tax=Helicobacter bilis TaxID=37372 RepID=UPI0026EB7C80|nr:hypothetical protein [Helicobacter bilis]MDD7295843.1 hypothetical protein [Helicobacter bilis]